MKNFKVNFIIFILICPFFIFANPDQNIPDDNKLNIIVFGAHPDDCEIDAGGMAVKWAQAGHRVKFVSTTNGDIGHAFMSGGELAKRRTAEVHKAAKILGVTTQVLDIHDGEIMPTLENRKLFVRLIREWNADIVIGHRPYDYHPDHRYTGVLLQDAAFMVTVSNFCPDVPHLSKNPVFLYSEDGFQNPYPFEPDIVVSIEDEFDTKFKAIWQLESQIESAWATGGFDRIVPVPKEGPEREERKANVKKWIAGRSENTANKYRGKLLELLSKNGKSVRYAEAFEVCEYGKQPTPKELKKLFLQ